MAGQRTKLIIIFFLVSSIASATNYYVSSSGGDDSRDGMSAATAWKTISKVNSKTFQPGDFVLFKRGDVWRETLVVPSSGNSGAYLTFGSYDNGVNPQILGSTSALTWTNQGGNVWKSATAVNNPYSGWAAEIFFMKSDGSVAWGSHVSGTGSLTSEYDWTWSSNSIYVYAPADPGSRYTAVEVPQRDYMIQLNSKQYITIDGIDMFFFKFAGAWEDYPTAGLHGYILRNCEIAYGGNWENDGEGHGSHVVYDDAVIEHNHIHDCGRRGISLNNYGTVTISNIIVQNNILEKGSHTTGIDICIGGGGGGNTGSMNNIIIRNNLFYDDPNESVKYSNQIFLQNYRYGGQTLTGIYIYGNIFRNPIATSISTWNIDQLFIYNNTFYGMNLVRTSNVFFISLTQANYNVTIKNNIFYGNTSYSHNLSGDCLYIESSADYRQVTADYNLYYQTDPNARIIEIQNLYTYHDNDIALIRSNLGWETHSPTPADPKFVSATDYHLQTGSPAISAGLVIPEVTTDFDGNPFNNPPNIGCYASSVSPNTPFYVSSVIENASPSVLTMTYSINLANIVPAPSAFTVKVNSVNRTVNTVAVSGTKVSLTLATPVVYGDIITITYTQPASNPLQSPTGELASTLSTPQSVTNNVNATIPVYSGSVIENATPSLLTMTYSLNLANIIPAVSAFSVKVNSIARTITTVAISGTKVLLTLDTPVVYGDIVTVDYNMPASNQLQSTSGGLAATITARSVTNNVLAVIPVYTSSVIENATPVLLTITYSLNLANITPAASAFTVLVNSAVRNINTVAISGAMVQLTLASPVVFGDIVTVAYTKPASNPLQSTTGGQAGTITAQPVTNNVVATIPVYVSSVIENATPALLTMTYSVSLANVIPAASAFSVLVNSVTRTISAIAISGTKVLLTLSSPVIYGDVITIAYTKPAINQLQSAGGGQASSISAQPVTNNLVLPVPVYLSSVIDDATPNILQLTFDLALANIVPATSAFRVRVNSVTRSITKVTISGTAVQLTLSSRVVFGDVVTVSYTRPSSNPLQTPAGGRAASFSSKSVTNNVKSIVPPVYMSSVIEDATPTKLEMTYDLTLANIVPAVSAFVVTVNSVVRSVTAVAISGNKVILTLTAPAVYGDIVTVAYTKPSVNPLQTPPGGQAASITGQPVTNNINNIVSPNNPVYVSSVVQDATPSLLVMTYDRALNNSIVPPSSAFLVMVNSIIMPVTYVTITGSNVQLTLGGVIVNGDVITVSYTKPASNQLQSASGGWQAASITDQPVINNTVLVPLNNPPVPVIEYPTIGYSGFVYDLDATKSYDTDNDPLIFSWIAPVSVAISSTSTSKIQFLAPVVQEAKLLEFTMSVSDGASIQTQIVPITILPYKPELKVAKVLNSVANSYDGTNYPGNLFDNNPQTQWSSNGDNQWIILKLSVPFRIDHVGIIFPPQLNRSAYFDIYAAKDSLSWEPVLLNAASCSFSGDFQVFLFPESKTNTEYSYIELVGHGNSVDTWNNFSELQIFGKQHLEDVQITIYPNPAHQVINIAIEYPNTVPVEETLVTPHVMRIYNTSGMLVSETLLDPGINNAELPIYLKTGVYIVHLLSGNVTVATNKLVVID